MRRRLCAQIALAAYLCLGLVWPNHAEEIEYPHFVIDNEDLSIDADWIYHSPQHRNGLSSDLIEDLQPVSGYDRQPAGWGEGSVGSRVQTAELYNCLESLSEVITTEWIYIDLNETGYASSPAGGL